MIWIPSKRTLILFITSAVLVAAGACRSTPSGSSPQALDAGTENPPVGQPPIQGAEVSPTPTPLTAPQAPPEKELADEPAADDELSETPGDTSDPQRAQQEALELCQSAAEFLDQGEIDDALAALDRAYELMLSLPSDGDATYLQAREDIRRLVAELIVRTYDSQRAAAAPPTTSWDLALPIVQNEHVQREIRSFTNGERESFLEGYRRSGRYRPMILAKLEQAGLPSQLSWMPLVESWFKVRALSRASALGMWQFIASTGQRYGLSRDAWVDERMDPERSTDAAIAYLTELHGLFGDWPKALAAYNCGEARVMRLNRQRPDEYLDFWDLYAQLPQETRRYVPRFFAALVILEDPAAYGMNLPEPLAPVDGFATVRVERSVKLDRLDGALGLDKGTLAALNPSLRHGATPKRAFDLRVPLEAEPSVAEQVAQLPEYSPPQPLYVTHRVRRGETLSGIAGRYRTSVSAIMRTNNLRSANRIWPGQRLRIPTRAGRAAAAGPAYNPAEGTHTVRSGDSLYSIARRYSTTVDDLKRENGLSSNTILPGQKLKVHPGSRDDLRRYQVRRGDTLSDIATRHGVSLSALLRANGLGSRSTIFPGQWLVIPS